MPATRELILPNGCLLPLAQRIVVYDTHREGEVPCLGCAFRPTCPAQLGDNVLMSSALMGESLEIARVCRRCGEPMRAWVVAGNRRTWTCTNTRWRQFSNIDSTLDSGWQPCGWTFTEMSARILA